MMFTYSLCVDADRFPATALRQLAITHPISARLREPTLLRSAQHSPTSQSETLPSASLEDGPGVSMRSGPVAPN